MMRSKLFLTIFLIPLCLFAQGNDQVFVPFLVDLDGYQAEKAEGISLKMGDMENITASREYEGSSENFLTVMIMKTNQATLFQPMIDETIDYSGPDGMFQTTTIDGFKTYITQEEGLNDGAVMILLDQSETGGTFVSFSYENGSLDEIKKIIGKFNLKAIHAKAKSL